MKELFETKMGQEASSQRASHGHSSSVRENNSNNMTISPRQSRSTSTSNRFRKPTTLLRPSINKRSSDPNASSVKKAKCPAENVPESRDRLLSCPDLHHHSESEMVKRLEKLLCPKVHTDMETIPEIPSCSQADLAAMKLFNGQNPPKISISSYLQRMVYYLGGIAENERKCGVDANVHSDLAIRYVLSAILYVERIQSRTGMVVTLYNVHRLLITGILIAAKVLDDFQPNQKYFADLGGVSTLELARLEAAFLQLCDYNVNVDPDMFAAKYASALERERVFSDVNEALSLGAVFSPKVTSVKTLRV